jgi:energy-coupling factor transporter transmembrane protein EcfT
MDFHILIIVGGVLLLVFLIIKLFSKTLFRIIGIGILAIGLGIYIFKIRSQSPDSKLSVINTLSVDEIQAAYCNSPKTKDDSLKCTCIAEPICNDLKTRFSESQLADMKNNKVKFIAELVISANNRRAEILGKLKQNKGEHLFNEFVEDIKNGKIFSKYTKNTN